MPRSLKWSLPSHFQTKISYTVFKSKKVWSYATTLTYVFKVWCLVKHMDSLCFCPQPVYRSLLNFMILNMFGQFSTKLKSQNHFSHTQNMLQTFEKKKKVLNIKQRAKMSYLTITSGLGTVTLKPFPANFCRSSKQPCTTCSSDRCSM